MVKWFLTAKNSKKKKKNKGKSGPVVQTLTEHAATNNTVEEEEEISLDKGECTLHHCTSTCHLLSNTLLTRWGRDKMVAVLQTTY